MGRVGQPRLKRAPKCDDCKKFIAAEQSFFFPLKQTKDESLILCKECFDIRVAAQEREYLVLYEAVKSR